MSKGTAVLLSAWLVLGLTFVSCGADEAGQDAQEITEDIQQETTGELGFTANGEDFVRSGFISSDGWHITFRHLYVTITGVTAYQTDPPYDPHSGEEIIGDVLVELNGVFTIDLAEGDENAEPILIGILDDVPAGHYNAISWSMIPSTEGPSKGYSVYIDAQAEKGNQSYNVRLGVETGYRYSAGEFVGDVRKGFVIPGESGELEMTFHFDHIFGDIEEPAECDLNMMALGFDPFAELMQEGTVEEDLTTLEGKISAETYAKLVEVLCTLGHTGEGHCHCAIIL
ncbi:MAG: DUF4382 domain-containing protein [Candidatus Aegiribacteria sp.]|nr:DUF4382 domain-containing protein [Candidatus Aegiribacteria sp.]